MKRVLRYTIALDDKPHAVPIGVPVLFDRSGPNRAPGMEARIDAWFEVHVPGTDWDPTTYEPRKQWVQVVGTGHPVPDSWRWLSSFYDGGLVWHLYRVPDKDVEE